ncbi:DUF4743 domain-containing protein, partial [Verminephrobacter aporrectodeae]
MSAPDDPSFGRWLAAARRMAQRPAPRPREAFVLAGQVVGSVAPGFLQQIDLARLAEQGGRLRQHSGAWHLEAAPEARTAALNALAVALRDAQLCGPWRNEQLAVCNPQGERLATVERGAVRVLGVGTCAVHLVGLASDGRMWVQQRARDKPNDPGLWDTLMGGMVGAADTLAQALARETWEEAGLRVADLVGVAHGGHVLLERPSSDGGGAGYMVERIDWFRARLPDGMLPCNQDGEVQRFELLPPSTLRAWLVQ